MGLRSEVHASGRFRALSGFVIDRAGTVAFGWNGSERARSGWLVWWRQWQHVRAPVSARRYRPLVPASWAQLGASAVEGSVDNVAVD